MHNVDNRLESLSVSEPSIEPTPHDEALELLLRCAAQVFHCKIVEVTQEQIVDPRTEYLFYLSVDTSNRTLFSAAKELCENIDGRSDHFRGRYTKINTTPTMVARLGRAAATVQPRAVSKVPMYKGLRTQA